MLRFVSGRDPLRDIPQHSPSPRRKAKYSSTWIPEDLHALTEETREHLYQKLNRLNERRPSKEIPSLPGKKRAVSVDDEVLDKKAVSPRPGLKRRPFSVAVGMADVFKESEELKERKPADELSKQQSGSDESISAQESSAIDSEHSEVETRSRKVSSQFGARNNLGRASPVRTKYVVISSFIAEESGEVSLEEGEEVEVLQKEPSGWWYIKNDFCEGWAPSAFLEPAADSWSTSPEATDQLDQPDNQEESCQIREKLDSCPREPDNMEQEKRFVQQEKLKVVINSFTKRNYSAYHSATKWQKSATKSQITI